jgi:hypothetical protein
MEGQYHCLRCAVRLEKEFQHTIRVMAREYNPPVQYQCCYQCGKNLLIAHMYAVNVDGHWFMACASCVDPERVNHWRQCRKRINDAYRVSRVSGSARKPLRETSSLRV